MVVFVDDSFYFFVVSEGCGGIVYNIVVIIWDILIVYLIGFIFMKVVCYILVGKKIEYFNYVKILFIF